MGHLPCILIRYLKQCKVLNMMAELYFEPGAHPERVAVEIRQALQEHGQDLFQGAWLDV